MDAVISDQRVGERQHLAGKRRVGQGFLVAHHAGGEDEFTRSDGLGSEQLPRIATAVGGQEDASARGGRWKRRGVSQAIGGVGDVEG